MIDRLPPQSLEAEQSVLGAILIDRDAVVEVAEFLRPEDFYRPANGRIYAAMLDLFERREPVDIVTVAEVARAARGPRGDRRPRLPLQPQQPDAHRRPCRPVRPDRRAQGGPAEPHRRRRPDRRIGYEDPAEIQEAIDRAESELFAVSQERVDAGFTPLKSLLHAAYDRLDYLHAHRGEISRRPDGLRRPRCADDRLPAERPDRPRGPPGGREDEPRAQHRRARRRQGAQDASASSASR